MPDLRVTNVRFEHYDFSNSLGVHESKPRISWQVRGDIPGFQQEAYEVEIQYLQHTLEAPNVQSSGKICSPSSLWNPWPFLEPLHSQQRVAIGVRVWATDGISSNWSSPVELETGLLETSEDWHCRRISAPASLDAAKPRAEDLFRREFTITGAVAAARLYITAQGVYVAEIDGKRVGDHFLAPGWTDYDDRLLYQTYDVTKLLPGAGTASCLGVRVAEGWFAGRLGFGGGKRNIWGDMTAVMAQLDIWYIDGRRDRVCTDETWSAAQGPVRLAELYDGEKYDARCEIDGWSLPIGDSSALLDSDQWLPVVVQSPLPETVKLVAGTCPPVRPQAVMQPVACTSTQSGKRIVDFGQNLVGVVRLKNMHGPEGHRIVLRHAEVLESGEISTRPLRHAAATDTYTHRKNSPSNLSWQPQSTFHGFRYVEVEGWMHERVELLSSIEAVVYYTDMNPLGLFSCSDSSVNRLFENIQWSMRGNFVSVPTDCPQRDERLGYTGDLAVFAPTATFLYDCFGILQNWLLDVEYTQKIQNGVPAIFAPNPMSSMGKNRPCAIWGDVTILAPWHMYEATGDLQILERQYSSMCSYLSTIPKNEAGLVHLWESTLFQLGDWLDPTTSHDKPWKGLTDPLLVANIFLVRSLGLMRRIASLLGKPDDVKTWTEQWRATRNEFLSEYTTATGRLVSDSQTAYALCICFDVLSQTQAKYAGSRLAEIVRRDNFEIGTGFAGTPFVCEALARSGHIQVAYAMLLNKNCPSWLYPVTMGATTIWERWDSLQPDGTVNPGEMTSFNHYAFGAIGKFLYERLAGLQCIEPGWKRSRAAPLVGADFTSAQASHMTPYGLVSVAWRLNNTQFTLEVCVPPQTVMEIVLPNGSQVEEVAGPCERHFALVSQRPRDWPVKAISNLPVPGE
ncbi:alpha-L-rhamnosidase [Aspergillus stella-maris]|uniref:alpha-L-rhamnosidase n=1 Tax=Aspergillus stella-maris TaxID=1810926 RepID=UPI003CCD3B6C